MCKELVAERRYYGVIENRFPFFCGAKTTIFLLETLKGSFHDNPKFSISKVSVLRIGIRKN